jgi:hypothetical protein
VSPATDETAPAVWIDGHPQLEAIAAAVWEQCRTEDSSLVVDDPRNIAVAALAAVLPASVDRADEEHRLALSEALGLGTGAPWNAIHARARTLRTADESAREGWEQAAIQRSRATAWREEAERAEAAAELRRVAAETPAAVTVHAVPLPGSNGISACCGRPPCEFVGERVTRDPAEVTCTPPAGGAPHPKEAP